MTPIHLALTFDDAYWAPAYATMRSVCLKTTRRRDLVFHLVHDGLGADHQADLLAITTEFGATLVDYDLTQTDVLSTRIAALPIPHARLHPIVYARLFLFDILPQTVERLVFLDSDIFVRAPIEQLYQTDLGGKAMGAVADFNGIEAQTRRDLKPKPFFDTAEPYFNAGILLLEGAQCRQIDMVAEVTARLTPDELAGIYFDQDILNIVMRGRWLPLDGRWNFQNPAPAHSSLDPFIVHYTGRAKPWRLSARIPFKRTYRHLMTNDLFYRYLRFRWRARINGALRRLLGGIRR